MSFKEFLNEQKMVGTGSDGFITLTAEFNNKKKIKIKNSIEKICDDAFKSYMLKVGYDINISNDTINIAIWSNLSSNNTINNKKSADMVVNDIFNKIKNKIIGASQLVTKDNKKIDLNNDGSLQAAYLIKIINPQ